VSAGVLSITPVGVALGFIPVVVVVTILFRWSLDGRSAIVSIARMLIQLVLIGYVLGYLFATDSAWLVITVLAVMLVAASLISMRPVNGQGTGRYRRALMSIAVGGIPTLWLVTQGVIEIEPWYQPRYLIPLGGMIFASAMNAVSLAGERFQAELDNGKGYFDARKLGLQAALIPLINMLLAVGLVSLPGMMTGQILSGVDPLVASRYQIVVMCMIFGSSGISAACYLLAAARDGNR
jgi:putative ABC transport system permease protein